MCSSTLFHAIRVYFSIFLLFRHTFIVSYVARRIYRVAATFTEYIEGRTYENYHVGKKSCRQRLPQTNVNGIHGKGGNLEIADIYWNSTEDAVLNIEVLLCVSCTSANEYSAVLFLPDQAQILLDHFNVIDEL